MSSGGDQEKRLQEVLAELLERRISLSLGEVERAIAAWRAGKEDAGHAHGATIRHAQRASALGARVARAGIEGPGALLRDAFDLALIDAAEFEKLTGRPVAEVPAAPSLDDEAAHGDVGSMPPKRDVIEKLLEDGPVLVHIDARAPGVDVPEAHRDSPKLILRLGFGLTPPIPDLTLDEQGVQATLTFRGKPYTCRVPWAALYAAVADDGRGLVWPEHVPAEVADELARLSRGDRVAPRASEMKDEPDKPRGRGSHLKLV